MCISALSWNLEDDVCRVSSQSLILSAPVGSIRWPMTSDGEDGETDDGWEEERTEGRTLCNLSPYF